MPPPATNGSECESGLARTDRTKPRNASRAPPPTLRSPRSGGSPLPRWRAAKAFRRAVAPASGRVRVPGVSLPAPLASSWRCATRPGLPRAGRVISRPLPPPGGVLQGQGEDLRVYVGQDEPVDLSALGACEGVEVVHS